MFLKSKDTGVMIEVLDSQALINPLHSTVAGRIQEGEEEQEPEEFSKRDLLFLSDETLPKCWLDPDYQKA